MKWYEPSGPVILGRDSHRRPAGPPCPLPGPLFLLLELGCSPHWLQGEHPALVGCNSVHVCGETRGENCICPYDPGKCPLEGAASASLVAVPPAWSGHAGFLPLTCTRGRRRLARVAHATEHISMCPQGLLLAGGSPRPEQEVWQSPAEGDPYLRFHLRLTWVHTFTDWRDKQNQSRYQNVTPPNEYVWIHSSWKMAMMQRRLEPRDCTIHALGLSSRHTHTQAGSRKTRGVLQSFRVTSDISAGDGI